MKHPHDAHYRHHFLWRRSHPPSLFYTAALAHVDTARGILNLLV